jgi:hypothetical protein
LPRQLLWWRPIRHFLKSLRIPPDEADCGPLRRQLEGDGLADAPACSGDNGNLPFKRFADDRHSLTSLISHS